MAEEEPLVGLSLALARLALAFLLPTPSNFYDFTLAWLLLYPLLGYLKSHLEPVARAVELPPLDEVLLQERRGALPRLGPHGLDSAVHVHINLTKDKVEGMG